MIVKGSDEEAAMLAETLPHMMLGVDHAFITITHKPGEPTNEAVRKVAESVGATISTFEWCNDFAAARNFNFSQVSEDYTHILWLDADDQVRGIQRLKGIIEEHPNVDAFAMFYLYSFDEWRNPLVVHQKTQILKNNGCVAWEGELHEDFKPTRTIETFLIKGLERIHLSEPSRFEAAKTRNLEVAQSQVAKKPEDPRSYWNLANALKALGKNEEAVEAFDTFLKRSHSDEEKYISRLRRAEAFWQLGRRSEAIEEARYALGTRPEYPDAYHLLGSLYYESGQWMKAVQHYLMGLERKPPYTTAIVYNPRDYDYTPMMNLAKCYFQLSRPDLALIMLEGCRKVYPKDTQLLKITKEMKKNAAEFESVVKIVAKLQKVTDKEKLRAELEKIPDAFKAHPGICNLRNVNFVREESTGRDISFFCGFTQEEWTPETAKKKGIGGSEEAVIWLSQLLADRGWNVTVYNNCGSKELKFGDVTYKPFWTFNYRDKVDVLVLWRSTKPLDWELNATKVFVDMHDVVPAGEFTPERVAKITKIFVKSKFQRDLFPLVADEKFVVVPNGIDPSTFDQDIPRDPMLVINTSAPNRGIAGLVEMWERVKEQVPEAKLQWAYGWENWDYVHGDDPQVMEWKDRLQKRMKELGVQELGRVSHSEVAKMYLRANIWAYPSGFAEIDCISLSKAMAAGAFPITTDFAALGEKQGHGGVFVHTDLTAETWAKPYTDDCSLTDPAQIRQSAEAIVHALKNPPSEEERKAMREWARNTFAWDKVADTWNTILSDELPHEQAA